MLCLLSIAGCQHKSPERLPTIETTNCDPRQRTDCWSVSEEVIADLLESKEQNVRLKDALKTCREKL